METLVGLSQCSGMQVLVAVLVVAVVSVVWSKTRLADKRKTLMGSDSTTVTQDDLRKTEFRDEGAFSFHDRLFTDSPGRGVMKVAGEEEDVFLVFGASECRRVMEDVENFSSNPFVDERLVALSTMEKEQHDKLIKYIKGGYSTSRVKDLEFLMEKILAKHTTNFDGDLYKMTKRFHMEISLVTSGLMEASEVSEDVVDDFIKYNDAGVRLMAPLGGIGMRSEISWLCMIRGVLSSFPGVLSMVFTVGIVGTWKLLRPDLFLRRRVRPYSGVWQFPELLKEMPAYFLALWRLMARAAEDSPAGNLLQGVLSGAVEPAEALAVAVQLMVNMTTANALMNVFHSAVTHPAGGDVVLPSRDQLVAESLHFQAPLMRNPRRAKKDVVVDGVQIPRDALVLVMIGAGNSRLPPDQSLTFGAGMHACLGRHLVVAEMRVFVDWLLEEVKTKTWKSLDTQRLVDVDVGNFGFSRYVGVFRDRTAAKRG